MRARAASGGCMSVSTAQNVSASINPNSVFLWFFFSQNHPAINHDPVLNVQQRCKQFVVDGAENEHSRVLLLCMEKLCNVLRLVSDFLKQRGVENDRNLKGSVRFEGKVNYEGEHLFVLWWKHGNRKSWNIPESSYACSIRKEGYHLIASVSKIFPEAQDGFKKHESPWIQL